MWDVTSMGVRGLTPWSWSNFEITDCQISNCKHFRLKIWDFTTKGVRGHFWNHKLLGFYLNWGHGGPWSWSIFKISHQISNFSIRDVTSMGVRGLAPWSWSYFEITDCQISNWKHFRLKTCDFTRMGVRGFPLKHFWNQKLVRFYFNGGHGACSLKLKHFEKYKLLDKRFEIFQP